MDIFNAVMGFISPVAEWLALGAASLFLVLGAIAISLKKRSAYVISAVFSGSLGFAFLSTRSMQSALFALSLFAAVAALVYPLFFVGGKREKREASEALASAQALPKVCKYERREESSGERYGVQLAYASEMAAKLARAPLSAADRLETETLQTSVLSCKGRNLNQEELFRLNDCLTALLKLAAKYKI